jgi:hypothetical protein
MGMLIAIHAPEGQATIAIEGDAEFGTSTVDPACFPPCNVTAWNKTQISVDHTQGDVGNPGGHLAIHAELRSAPLSKFTLKLSCTAGASMWFRLDGETRKYTCPMNSYRLYPFFGLVGGAVTDNRDELKEVFPLVADSEEA